jgi:hypothetical protein
MADSTRVRTSAARGGTIITETSHVTEATGVNRREGLVGREMGGGPRDLSHSMTGGGSVSKK